MFRIRILWLDHFHIQIEEQIRSTRNALKWTVVVVCAHVVHKGEQPVALIGLGLPKETPVITVVEKLKGSHSWGECVMKVAF